MNILVLAPEPFFQNRGTPIAVKELVATLTASGHTIDLAAYHEGEKVQIPNCQIHRALALPGLNSIQPGFSFKKIFCDILLFFKALNLVIFNRYDLIHAVEEAAFMGVFFQLVFRIPFVYDMDSSLPRQISDRYRLPSFVQRILESMERLTVRRSLGVLAVCKSLEELARGCDPAKIIGRLEDKSLVNTENSGDEDLRKQLSLAGPMSMYVGNLESYQGIDLLLETHQFTLREVPDAELVVIGGREVHIAHYRQRAQQLGIADRTHFTGPRPKEQLGFFLRQADVLVSPRIKGNNTPMKIYSYLDSRRPVLATHLSTHTQVLDKDIAYLAEPLPATMAQGLVTLLRDPDLRELLATKAKVRIDEEYSPAAFTRKLNTFYHSLEVAIHSQPAPASTTETAPGPPTTNDKTVER